MAYGEGQWFRLPQVYVHTKFVVGLGTYNTNVWKQIGGSGAYSSSFLGDGAFHNLYNALIVSDLPTDLPNILLQRVR